MILSTLGTIARIVGIGMMAGSCSLLLIAAWLYVKNRGMALDD